MRRLEQEHALHHVHVRVVEQRPQKPLAAGPMVARSSGDGAHKAAVGCGMAATIVGQGILAAVHSVRVCLPSVLLFLGMRLGSWSGITGFR